MNKSKTILTFSLLSLLILLIATAAFAAVEVNYFRLQGWVDNVVTVEWQTGSEGDIGGFYVWRSETNVLIQDIGSNPEEQGLVLLNPNDPVTTDGIRCDPGNSEDYTYPDDTVADGQDIYYYYLQADKCLSSTLEFYEEQAGDGGVEATRPTTSTPTPTPTVTVAVTVTATATPSGSVLYLPIITQASASR